MMLLIKSLFVVFWVLLGLVVLRDDLYDDDVEIVQQMYIIFSGVMMFMASLG